jgi:hypothetical protein
MPVLSFEVKSHLESGTPGITRISLFILYAKYLLCRVSLKLNNAQTTQKEEDRRQRQEQELHGTILSGVN